MCPSKAFALTQCIPNIAQIGPVAALLASFFLSLTGSGTFGSELVHALAGPDPFIAARAAAVIRGVLDGNPAGKVYLRIALFDMLM